jgi:hypothetical protein
MGNKSKDKMDQADRVFRGGRLFIQLSGNIIEAGGIA